MVDTYRARHAIRDVGKALGLPEVEVDFVAKAFPHTRAGAVRQAMAELPELRGSNLDAGQLETLFSLVERLDGFPRHLALHPSGIILSDYDLPDRVPLERSLRGFSMAQYDKDDVEDLGLMKLDVLGVRMQSAIAHALCEVRRVKGVDLDIDAVPRDDEETFRLIRSSRTLGCFQIESPGQRELLGKLQPTWFGDLIVDISLFRPGPVKSDMVRPFLEGRLGFRPPAYAHPRLREVLGETFGVIVYHEQVMRVARAIAGYSLAEADLLRRRLSNDPEVCARLREEFLARAESGGVPSSQAGPIFDDLAAFASFGFCKAHAAAFALPTYQSAYLKVHETAAFLAGVLTHDPGMYPRRLILEDARQFGVPILPLDVNRSAREYTMEEVDAGTECLYRPPGNQALTAKAARGPRRRGDGPPASADLETRSGLAGMDRLPAAIAGAPVADPRYGIRLGLQDVKGISDAEIEEILTKRPFVNLADFCVRAAVSRPVAENLVEASAFRDVERGVSRRDLFLLVSERWQARGSSRSASGRSTSRRSVGSGNRTTDGAVTDPLPFPEFQDPLPGLRDYSAEETVQAELEVLGLDASCHLLDFYRPLLDVLGVVPAVRLRDRNRSGARVRVAGVKVASQTPPVKSGRRVIFITLDDSTGCADVTFFSSVQEWCARTIFHSWLLLAEGNLRKTGARGVSINGEMAWDLRRLWRAWKEGRLDEVLIQGTEGEVAREPAIAGSYGEEATSGRGRPPTRRMWQASAGSAG
jgi:error-prone DNA polymerase